MRNIIKTLLLLVCENHKQNLAYTYIFLHNETSRIILMLVVKITQMNINS